MTPLTRLTWRLFKRTTSVWSWGAERAITEATTATPPMRTTRAKNPRSLGLKPAYGALALGGGTAAEATGFALAPLATGAALLLGAALG
jgi:hypothetical protein